MSINPELPKPPPMRAIRDYIWVNEWELVDWYTDKGVEYGNIVTSGKTIFDKLLGCEYKTKLEASLERNRLNAN